MGEVTLILVNAILHVPRMSKGGGGPFNLPAAIRATLGCRPQDNLSEERPWRLQSIQFEERYRATVGLPVLSLFFRAVAGGFLLPGREVVPKKVLDRIDGHVELMTPILN